MKPHTQQLLQLLSSRSSFGKVDLYTLTLQDGTVIRSTSSDRNISWAGNTYFSDSPMMQRTKVRLVIGIEVDSMTLTIMSPDDLVSGFTYREAARRGIFDGCSVLVETAYIENFPFPVGVVHTFSGLVSGIEAGRSSIEMEVKSSLELLSSPFPRNVYQSTCLHTLYDSGCAVNRASYTVAGQVLGALSQKSMTSDIVVYSDGYFDLGVVTFTSGPNNGLSRSVKSYSNDGTFSFSSPLPALPLSGDSFSAIPGCDKLLGTCRSKFNNSNRFRGFPFIPTPETIY